MNRFKNRSDNTRVNRPLLLNSIKDLKLERQADENELKRKQGSFDNYDNSVEANEARKQNRYNEKLLNSQHLWRVDPTRKVANTPQEAAKEFNAQKSLVNATVEGMGVAMGGSALKLAPKATLTALGTGIVGSQGAKETSKLITNNENVHNIAEFAGGMLGPTSLLKTTQKGQNLIKSVNKKIKPVRKQLNASSRISRLLKKNYSDNHEGDKGIINLRKREDKIDAKRRQSHIDFLDNLNKISNSKFNPSKRLVKEAYNTLPKSDHSVEIVPETLKQYAEFKGVNPFKPGFVDDYLNKQTLMVRGVKADNLEQGLKFASTIPENPTGGTRIGNGLYNSNSTGLAKAFSQGEGYIAFNRLLLKGKNGMQKAKDYDNIIKHKNDINNPSINPNKNLIYTKEGLDHLRSKGIVGITDKYVGNQAGKQVNEISIIDPSRIKTENIYKVDDPKLIERINQGQGGRWGRGQVRDEELFFGKNKDKLEPRREIYSNYINNSKESLRFNNKINDQIKELNFNNDIKHNVLTQAYLNARKETTFKSDIFQKNFHNLQNIRSNYYNKPLVKGLTKLENNMPKIILGGTGIGLSYGGLSYYNSNKSKEEFKKTPEYKKQIEEDKLKYKNFIDNGGTDKEWRELQFKNK